MSLAVGPSLHQLYGLAGSYTPAGGSAVATTIRCQAGQSVQGRDRRQRTARLTAILYLLTSAVAVQPRRDDAIDITAVGETWLGNWILDADAEPSGADEWRCLCVRETTDHTLTTGAGAPRRRS